MEYGSAVRGSISADSKVEDNAKQTEVKAKCFHTA
jgi:hypothetical protein